MGIILFIAFIYIILLHKRIIDIENSLHSVKEKSTKIDQKFFSEISVKADIHSDNISIEKNNDSKVNIIESSKIKNEKIIKKDNFEKQIGSKLAIWMGGISIAVAGFFIVKYSIEQNLLSPATRTIFGTLFGAVLIYAGYYIKNNSYTNNSTKISQSLIGAGITDLYICCFAANSIYKLIPDIFGFIIAGFITLLTVFLSLFYGAPIAIGGMIGGLLAPALFDYYSININLLLCYLYLLFTIFSSLVNFRNWIIFTPLILIAIYAWLIVFINFDFNNYTVNMLIFLAAMIVSFIFNYRKYDIKYNSVANNSSTLFNINLFAIVSTILFAAYIVKLSKFNEFELSVFWLIAAGTIILKYFDYKNYYFAPWISLITSALIIYNCQNFNIHNYYLFIVSYAILFIASSYFCLFKTKSNSVSWGSLLFASSIIYYLLAYNYFIINIAIKDYNVLWMIIAILLAGGAIFIINEILLIEDKETIVNQKLLSIFSVAVVSFISIGFAIISAINLYSFVISIQILVLSWINNKVYIKSLRKIITALCVLYGLVLLPQLINLSIGAFPLTTIEIPLLQFGSGVIALFCGSYNLRQTRDDKLVWYMELASSLLFLMMIFYVSRQLLYPNQNPFTVSISYSMIIFTTNIMLLYTTGCFIYGNKYFRPSFIYTSKIISLISGFRIIYFHLLFNNPLFSHVSVGNLPIFNWLIFAYAVPAIILHHLNEKLGSNEAYFKLKRYNHLIIMFLIFAYISLNVRQLFHGEYLQGITSSAEFYSYSIAWLIMGICLLYLGIIKNDKSIRLASLVVIVITIGKVFLLDASQLTGLYRIFSFLGLGLSLFGLSYCYSKYVFKEKLINN